MATKIARATPEAGVGRGMAAKTRGTPESCMAKVGITGAVALPVASRPVVHRRQVEEQLGQTAFGGSVVSQDGGEGGITERLGKTLAKGFTSAGVVGEAD